MVALCGVFLCCGVLLPGMLLSGCDLPSAAAGDSTASAKSHITFLPEVAPPPGDPRRYSFDLRHAPWGEVLQEFAFVTGSRLLMEAAPSGQINYRDSKLRDVDEATAVLHGLLKQAGYGLIRNGREIIVVPTAPERLYRSESAPRPNSVPHRKPASRAPQTRAASVSEPLITAKPTGMAEASPFQPLPDAADVPVAEVRQSPGSRPPAEEPITPGLPGMGNPEESRFSFNFQGVPWDRVITRFADEAGLSLQMDVAPPGVFNYQDPRRHTITQVLDVLNDRLLRAGYLLVRRDRSLILVDATDERGIPRSLVPEVDRFELENRGRNELLSIAIPVPGGNLAEAAREAEGLLGPLGSVVRLDGSQRIYVTDVGSNLRRIHRILAEDAQVHLRMPHAVIQLHNSQAEEVAKAVSAFFNPQLAAGVTGQVAAATGGSVVPVGRQPVVVVPEPATNSLVITGPRHLVDHARQVVAELDHNPAQVVIQALLVEVELGNTEELGVEVGVQDSVLFHRSVIDDILTITETVTNPGTGTQTTNQTIVSQTASPGFNFNNPTLGNNVAIHPGRVGTQALSNLAVGRVNGDLGYGGLVLSAGSESINVMLRALSEHRKVDILSRPQIRTLSNRKAKIQIGQQVPVVDGVAVNSVGSANPVIRQDDAGIILGVIPRINPDGTVVLDVKAEKSQFQTAPGTGVPIFTDATSGNVIEAPIKDITSAEATVRIETGQTIVLGGMITKGKVRVDRKVPVLGDIPLLGHAFRYDLDQTIRKELLIFLTPQVVDGRLESDRIKNEEISRVHLPVRSVMQLQREVLEDSGPTPVDDAVWMTPSDSLFAPDGVPLHSVPPTGEESGMIPAPGIEVPSDSSSEPGPMLPLPPLPAAPEPEADADPWADSGTVRGQVSDSRTSPDSAGPPRRSVWRFWQRRKKR